MVWSPVTGKILETSSEENCPQVPLKVNLSSASGHLLCCKTRRQWTLYIYIIWLKEAPTDFWSLYKLNLVLYKPWRPPNQVDKDDIVVTSGHRWQVNISVDCFHPRCQTEQDFPFQLNSKPFLLFPLSWHWPGKIIPSATTSGPLLRKVIFRIYKTFLFQARGKKLIDSWL